MESISSNILTGSIILFGISVISYLHERAIFFNKLYYDLLSLYIMTDYSCCMIFKIINKLDENHCVSERDYKIIIGLPERIENAMKNLIIMSNDIERYINDYTSFLPFIFFEKRIFRSLQMIEQYVSPSIRNLQLAISRFTLNNRKLKLELMNKNIAVHNYDYEVVYYNKETILLIAERFKEIRNVIDNQLVNILRHSDGYEPLLSSYYEVDLLKRRVENDKKIIKDSHKDQLSEI